MNEDFAKEIIINGVDVTACQNYNRRTEKCKIPCWINNIKCTGLNCSDIKDCYFKQLARAEQKLEKIKELVTQCDSVYDCFECDMQKECYEKDGMARMLLQIIEGE